MRRLDLLQNAAPLMKQCAHYYKMPQWLLQNALLITEYVVIAKFCGTVFFPLLQPFLSVLCLINRVLFSGWLGLKRWGIQH